MGVLNHQQYWYHVFELYPPKKIDGKYIDMFSSSMSTPAKFLQVTSFWRINVPKLKRQTETNRQKRKNLKERSGDGGSHPKPNGCGGWNLDKGGWRPWRRLGVWHVNSIQFSYAFQLGGKTG